MTSAPPALAVAASPTATEAVAIVVPAEPLVGELAQACGSNDPGPICAWLYGRTGSAVLARLGGQVIPSALRIVVILLGAFILARVLRRLVARLVVRTVAEGRDALAALRRRASTGEEVPELDRDASARAEARAATIAGVLGSVVTAVVWTIASMMVLGVFRVNLGPLIASAGIVGVALGFGAQSLVKDFISGVFMLLEDQYGVGDVVDVGEANGTVEAISLRVTRLRDVEGTVWHVPNGEIRRVGNKSQIWSRSLIDVGVAYDTDVDAATEVIKDVLDQLWHDEAWATDILEEPEVWGIERFGPDEVTIRLVVKTRPARQWAVNRELRRRLKQRFDQEGIEIPFPQRTVWVRSRPDVADT